MAEAQEVITREDARLLLRWLGDAQRGVFAASGVERPLPSDEVALARRLRGLRDGHVDGVLCA